jgi:hypothetical protein
MGNVVVEVPCKPHWSVTVTKMKSSEPRNSKLSESAAATQYHIIASKVKLFKGFGVEEEISPVVMANPRNLLHKTRSDLGPLERIERVFRKIEGSIEMGMWKSLQENRRKYRDGHVEKPRAWQTRIVPPPQTG